MSDVQPLWIIFSLTNDRQCCWFFLPKPYLKPPFWLFWPTTWLVFHSVVLFLFQAEHPKTDLVGPSNTIIKGSPFLTPSSNHPYRYPNLSLYFLRHNRYNSNSVGLLSKPLQFIHHPIHGDFSRLVVISIFDLPSSRLALPRNRVSTVNFTWATLVGFQSTPPHF